MKLKMKRILAQLLLVLLAITSANAQKQTIEINALPRLWLKSTDAHHDEFENDALNSANRLSYGFDATYRRHLSSKFNLGFNLGYGRYSDKFVVIYNSKELGNLRDDGKFNNTGYNGSFLNQTGFFSFGIIAGYRLFVQKSNWIGIDLGVRKLLFGNKDGHFTSKLTLPQNPKNYEFATLYWRTGNSGKKISGPILAEASVTYNFINKKNKTFIVGLNGTVCPSQSLNGQNSNDYTTLKDYKTDVNGNKVEVPIGIKYGEQSKPKYASISLKLGIALFKF